jgi:hypothetical protein
MCGSHQQAVRRTVIFGTWYGFIHLFISHPTHLPVLVVIKRRTSAEIATPISMATTYLFVLIPSPQVLPLLSTSIIFAVPSHPPSLMIPWVTHTSYPLSFLFEAECHFTLMYVHEHLPQLFCLHLLHSMVSAVNSHCVPQSGDPVTKTHAERPVTFMPPLHTELCFIPRTLTLPFSASPDHASALAPAVNFKPSP